MRIRTKKQALSTILATALMAGSLFAEENLWVYTKGTDTRPQGSWEFKLSNISRLDKDSGDYAFHDFRPEIEYGITDRLTVGAEIFIFSHDYSNVDPVGETRDPVVGSYTGTGLGGFEIMAKYNLLSPYKDFMGLSVAAGYERRDLYRLDGSSINQDALVLQVLAQKNFLDDRLVFAANAKMELERRESPEGAEETVLEEEIAFDLSAGVSYRVAPKWFVGLELRWQSDFLNPQVDGEFEEGIRRSSWDLDDMRLGDQFQYGTYLGPTVHYAEEGWWATVGALYLIDSGGDERRNGAVQETGKAWDEHERWHVGLSVGFEF